MSKARSFFLLGLVAILLGFQAMASSQETSATRYLAFQMFTAAPDPSVPIGASGNLPLPPPPNRDAMRDFAQRLVVEIGTTGDSETKLAFIIGPLAFDHSDSQLQEMIADAFELAIELDIAVGFHIDDSMFWARRSDLWEAPANVEWLDWEGTPNTGRRIDWGPTPTRLAPQMCFNSLAIQAEVQRLARDVIGTAVSDGIARLQSEGRQDLFAGMIVGWETMIGRDFETNQVLGYCALTNLGFSRENPPQDLDAERVRVVQDFIELWAGGLAEAGVNPEKIFSHIAVVPQLAYANMPESATISYSQINQFAPLSVSFGTAYNPGFSTYPQEGLMEQLYNEIDSHGNPAWASSEGANINPATLTSGGSMETYLGWMFNHGAVLVTIFGWGVGSESNPFHLAASSADALLAYRKFLSGDSLIEAEYAFPDLASKIQTIQAELPAWLEQHPERQPEIEALLHELDQYIREGNYAEASRVADELLTIMEE